MRRKLEDDCARKKAEHPQKLEIAMTEIGVCLLRDTSVAGVTEIIESLTLQLEDNHSA
jgi:hypothetical protein